MSLAAIRSALEAHLATVLDIDVVHENVPYTPVADTPYAEAWLLPATPANIEMGPGYTEQGIFAVNIFYPKDAGAGAATARAEMVRAGFRFADSLSSGGTTVNITATPEIGPARAEADRWMIPTKVRWLARQ